MATISVLIPSYNRPEYVAQAVASVLESDFHDFELIVSDDCSPRQQEIVRALAPFEGDKRLIFEAQASNLGEARNRQFLMRKARGKYFIILGDDDLIDRQALSRLDEYISLNPGYSIYLFGYSIIDESGRIYETRRALAPVELSLTNRRVLKDLFSSDMFPFWLYHPATFCCVASLHFEITPNHEIGIGDDFIFLFDSILAGKRALIIPLVLFSYRKFMGPRPYAQGNLSKAKFANVVTRRHMLYNLLGRQGLPSEISSFLRTREFRQRFLYDAILSDPDVTTVFVDQLDLAPEHLAEFRCYSKNRQKSWFGLWLTLGRIWAYAGYFGLAGLVESLRVFWQRKAYRKSIRLL